MVDEKLSNKDMSNFVDVYSVELKKKWEQVKNPKSGLFSSTIDLAVAVRFILTSLDEAIKYAQDNIVLGADKKAFVLNVIARLYDVAVAANLPYWIYPFAGWLKTFLIDNLISNLIDWIITKYRDGSWKTV